MMLLRPLAPILLALSALSACATRYGDFSTLSNRSLPPPGHLGPHVVGTDCTWNVFAIPVGEYSLEQAVDNAMASAPNAQYLTDVTVRRTGWWMGKTCYRVEGTLVFADPPASSGAAPQPTAAPAAPAAPAPAPGGPFALQPVTAASR